VTGAETPQGLPPLWVAVGTVLVLGAVAVLAILASTRRQQREMDRLAEAMWEADREWRRAMLAYLTRPPERPKPPVKPVPDDAITVELEVIKPERVKGEWRDDG
jgi:hypothetical protein